MYFCANIIKWDNVGTSFFYSLMLIALRKSQVLEKTTLEALEMNINQVINEIGPELLENVENFNFMFLCTQKTSFINMATNK